MSSRYTLAQSTSSCLFFHSLIITLLASSVFFPRFAAAVQNNTDATGNIQKNQESNQLTFANDHLAWRLDWGSGCLKSQRLENKLSGQNVTLSDVQEISLAFFAAIDSVQEPIVRVADFAVHSMRLSERNYAIFELCSPAMAIDVTAHYQLDGPTRRKWLKRF